MKSGRSDTIVQWLAGHVFPFERELRTRLRRNGAALQDIDDIVQDTYALLAGVADPERIVDGRAYLFATAQHVVLNRVRHNRVVRIDEFVDREVLTLVDETPGPERRIIARQELARVGELIAQLPARCRRVFELRRIEGMSQRLIAERLGISEEMVEYEASRGLRLLQDTLRAAPANSDTTLLRHQLSLRFRRGRPRK